MLPLLLAGGLLCGAAYAAWQLIRSARSHTGSGNGPSQPGPPGGDGASKEPATELTTHEPDWSAEEIIRRVVAGVKFATKQMKIGQRVVGAEEHPSPFPADDIEVRPLRSLAEAPRAVPATYGYSDDIWYAQAASGQLPVIEHIERVDLTENVMGKSRNVLLMLQDISGSMADKTNRVPWAIRLISQLVDKCIKEDGEFIFIRFQDNPFEPIVVRTAEEAEEFKRNLSWLLATGGGTNLDRALMGGMNVLEQQQFGEARIVLCTDGTEAINTDETQERKRRLGVFLHTIVIGKHHDQLQEVSDKYDELLDEVEE